MTLATHADIEFAVDDTRSDPVFKTYFKTFAQALHFAADLALSTGESVALDVLIHSRAAAEAWGGSEAAEQYDDDPEASVFERLMIKVTSQGRVP